MTNSSAETKMATPRVAAGALFLDNRGRALLVRTTYKESWDIPGGYVERGESPRAACDREIAEELGIRVSAGELLSVDWAPHPDEGDKLLFIFNGGTLTDEQLAAVRFADGEIAEIAFVTREDIDRLTVPRLAQRLQSTLDAVAERRAAYLEAGEPAGSRPAAGLPGLA